MSTMQEKIRRHREAGRGRKATWIAVGIAALLAAIWMAPTITGHSQGERFGGLRRMRAHDRSLTELADELREHTRWAEFAGLSATQSEQIAELLDAKSPVFEDLDSQQAKLTERAANALAASDLDPTELTTLRTDMRRLADEAVDESFDLVVEAAELLTPQQRADLVGHWRDR